MQDKPLFNLSPLSGKKGSVVLLSVTADITFNNLLCSTKLTQVYKNLDSSPIEAIYTFPLSSRALLSDMYVIIGGKRRVATVMAKENAVSEYEEAILKGDAAIMLEEVEKGLYTLNVGNILPKEEIEVTLCYSELYSWIGDMLRFHLPTAIAPRYGDPESAGLQPHQIPQYSTDQKHFLFLSVNVSGILAKTSISSPSHAITKTQDKDILNITFKEGNSFLDRDFILLFKSASKKDDSVVVDRDVNDRFTLLASFVPKIDAFSQPSPPRNIKLLIDCSGSMEGESIEQAKYALVDMLGRLRPSDYFNVILFGSQFYSISEVMIQATKNNINQVRRKIRNIEANLGGTEMGAAMEAAFNIPGPSIPSEILIITDGEVWESEYIIEQAEKSGHRIFSFGVGYAVSEAFLKQLAERTGGACELAVPREHMADKIVHHFQRIYQPKLNKVEIMWPDEPEMTIPARINQVYSGDTLHVFARFEKKPAGHVTLLMETEEGQRLEQRAIIPEMVQLPQSGHPPGIITRMAMQIALQQEEDQAKYVDLAIKYKLLTPHTNYLLIEEQISNHERNKLPVIYTVKNMLAHGWGGYDAEDHDFAMCFFCNDQDDDDDILWLVASDIPKICFNEMNGDLTYLEPIINKKISKILTLLSIGGRNELMQTEFPFTFWVEIGKVKQNLEHDTGFEEELIIFLYMFLRSKAGSMISEKNRELILKLYENLNIDEDQEAKILAVIPHIRWDFLVNHYN